MRIGYFPISKPFLPSDFHAYDSTECPLVKVMNDIQIAISNGQYLSLIFLKVWTQLITPFSLEHFLLLAPHALCFPPILLGTPWFLSSSSPTSHSSWVLLSSPVALYVDDSPICISSPDLSFEFYTCMHIHISNCLINIPTWLSNRHLERNTTKTKFLISTPKSNSSHLWKWQPYTWVSLDSSLTLISTSDPSVNYLTLPLKYMF